MRLIVGLGNPGREYARTRHNIGFMVVDEIMRRTGDGSFRLRFKALVGESFLGTEKLVLVKPQTYMNLSGNSVREAVGWYHADIDDLLVIQDDLDLPFGQLRMRARGSAGGHNGIASIVQQLGTSEVARLKIGIGRGRAAADRYVLGRFSAEQEQELQDIIIDAANAVELWVREGIERAMNDTNRKPATAASAGAEAGRADG